MKTDLQELNKRRAGARERKLAAAEDAAADKKAEAKAAAKVRSDEAKSESGLTLLSETVQGTRGQFGGEITGTVVNRTDRKYRYAQITFNLYDGSGAQVGSALANINGLEPGGSWKFKATSFGTDFKKYKFSELTGF